MNIYNPRTILDQEAILYALYVRMGNNHDYTLGQLKMLYWLLDHRETHVTAYQRAVRTMTAWEDQRQDEKDGR